MANVNGMGTVFNLPNFAGQLYSSSPIVTPFLNLIRGKAVKTDNFQFAVGVEYAHETATQPAISETASVTNSYQLCALTEHQCHTDLQ